MKRILSGNAPHGSALSLISELSEYALQFGRPKQGCVLESASPLFTNRSLFKIPPKRSRSVFSTFDGELGMQSKRSDGNHFSFGKKII